MYLVGTEATKELKRQEMAGRQQSPPPIVNKKELNVFESTQMDPFVAVSLCNCATNGK